MMRIKMNQKKSPLSRMITPPPDENLTMREYLMQQYPLPIGDLIQEPLTTEPWWKFQTMYFHHLLRLHPDHPNYTAPEHWDPKILAGPVAKHTLIIRDLVLEMQKEMKYDKAKEIPKKIKEILPLLQSITS